jgi:hypothetical protein
MIKEEILKLYKPLNLSEDFIGILRIMVNPISKELLEINSNNKKRFDISFIDISGKGGMVTLFPVNKIPKLTPEQQSELDTKVDKNSFIWSSPLRTQPMKIGRFLLKIISDKSKKLVEDFVNEFKSLVSGVEENMKIVYGEDIRKYYLEDYYCQLEGTLSNSCMRYQSTQKYLDIYCENTPKSDGFSHVGMLVLFDNYGKVSGRAILWFNSYKPKGKVFMDRVYTAKDQDYVTFINYAKKRGWLYKYLNKSGETRYVDPADSKIHTLTLSFYLIRKDYDYYPYMDSLRFYTPTHGRLATAIPGNSKFKTYKLTSTDGSYGVVSF